jgi:FMN phosphatase YigB (HAD superfamily)
MSHIPYIFRDFRWVVASVKSLKHNYANQIAKAYSISVPKLKKIIEPYKSKFHRWEIWEKEFWKLLSGAIGKATPEEVKKIFHKDPNTYAVLHKNITKFVHKLQTLWYASIVLSDVFAPKKKLLQKNWRYNGFDDVLLSCDIWLCKYDDRNNNTTTTFAYACKKYKVTPKEVIYIDDKKGNCILAKRLGCKTIVAKNSLQVIKDIKNILKI